MGQGITVPISLLISNLLNIVTMLLSKLSNLKVGTSGFKALLNVIATILKDIDKLTILTDKPFVSANLFTAADRAVNKLEEDLDKVQIAVSRIKFSDLELDPSLTAELKSFETLIESIKNSLKTVKETAKLAFLDSDVGKGWAHDHAEATTLTLSQLTTAISKEVDKLQRELNAAQEAVANYQRTLSVSKNINKFMSKSSGHQLSEATMGKELFQLVFKTNTEGEVTRFLNGGKPLLQQWLQEQFDLDSATILSLTTGAGDAIVKAFSEIGGKVEATLKALLLKMRNAATELKTATNKGTTLDAAVNEKAAKLELAQATQAQLVASNTSVSTSEALLRAELEQTKQLLAEYKERLAEAVRTNPDWTNSNKLANAALELLKSTLSQTNAQFLQQQRVTQSFNSMKMAIVNFMGFNLVLNITRRAVREAINHIKELDTVMNGIAIVTDMSTGDLWTLIDQYSKMAQAYGVSITGAYEVSQIYYQLGLETADVMTLTNETLKLAKISGLDYATTTDYMTTAIRGFKMEMSEASTVVDVYSNLAAHTAVSQEELAVAMSKTASSMEGVGATFEEASAMIGTMVAVTRESATNIGSAMKSIASRYGELTKDPTKLVDEEGEAMAFNKVDAALQSVGISMRTVDGLFREFTDVIVELGEKWDQLDSTQQRYIATQFAGNRQQSRFLALVGNVDLLKSNLDVAMNSEDTGTLQALKALDSIESKTELVKVAYQLFYTTIGAENIWKGFLDGTKNVINTLNGLPKLFGKIPIGAITAITSIISVIKSLGMDLLNAFALTIGLSMLLGALLAQGQALQGALSLIGIVLNTLKSKKEEFTAAGKEGAEAYTQGILLGNTTSITPNKLTGQDKITYDNNQNIIDTFKTKTALFSVTGADDLNSAYAILANQMQGLPVDILEKINADESLAKLLLDDYIASLEKANLKLLETGNTAELSGGKLKNFVANHKNLGLGLQSFGSALNMLAMMINTTAEGGKTWSGVLLGMASAATLAGVAVKVLDSGLKSMPWMALASGILMAVNAISTLIVTPLERLEELENKAEELSNKAKEAKADYRTLDNSVKKLDELREKRYESAEAAEEYLTAVDELADKFPLMIAGFDAAGNIILDTTNAEELLTRAREKSAKAAFEAAEAELKTQREKTNLALSKILTTQLQTDGTDSGLTTPLKDSLHDYLETVIPSDDELAMFNLQPTSHVTSMRTLSEALEAFYYNVYYPYVTALDENELATNDFVSSFSFLDQYGIDENGNFSYDKLQKAFSSNQITMSPEIQEFYDAFFNPADLAVQLFTQAIEEYNQLDGTADLKTRLTALKKARKAFTEGKELGAFSATNIENIEKFLGLVNDVIGDYEDELLTMAGMRKSTISLWQLTLTNDGKAWTYLEDSAAAAALVTNQINSDWDDREKAEGLTFTVNTENYKAIRKEDYIALMEAFWINLNDELKKLFDSMFEDSLYYTQGDFSEVFGLIKGFKEIEPLLTSYYANSAESIAKRLNNRLSLVLGNKPDENGEYADIWYANVEDSPFAREFAYVTNKGNSTGQRTLAEERYLNSILDQYENLRDDGYKQRAESFGWNAMQLFKSINNAPAEIEKLLWNLVEENGLNTIEGIEKIKTTIANNPELSSYVNTDVLNILQNNIIPNISLAIQTATSDLLENWESTSKELSSAMSGGVSLKDADALINKAKNLGLDFSLQDFLLVGDKLILINQSFDEYYKALIASTTSIAADWSTRIQNASALLEEHKNDKNTWQYTEDERALLQSIGFDLTNPEYMKYGELTITGIQALELAIQLSQNNLTNYNTSAEIAAKLLARSYNWSQGNYFDYEIAGEDGTTQIYKSIVHNIKDIQNKIAEDRNSRFGKNTEERAMLDNIYSAYDTLISDVFSKGIENIHLDDYEGLIDVDNANLQAVLQEGSYQNFINEYAQFAGKSIDETNELLALAIEKLQETTASEILSNLQFINKNQFAASLSDLTELANRFDIGLGQLTTNWDQALGAYIVDFTQFKEFNNFTDVENYQAIINDSVNEFFSNLVNLVKSALSGSLSNTDRGQLDLWVADYNEKFGANLKLDFTKTAEGLKMSEDSAIGLYSALKQVDTLQASLVFDELNKSLQESNEHYKTASANLAHITDIETKLNYELNKKTIQQNSNKVPLFDELIEHGNVDNLYNRPRIANEDGSYSTLLTTTLDSRNYESDIPWVMNITPITKEGKLLDDAFLDDYVLKLINGTDGSLEAILEADKNDLGLIIEMADAANKDQDALAESMGARGELLHEISEAYEAIKDGETYDDTKILLYKDELNLAKEIAAVRSTTEDSSFSFMSNKIPSGLNNPLNYWKNWGEAWKTLEESSKTGTMDYTDFYNIITEMGNLAERSGAITVGAGTVLENSQDAANLINAAAQSLKVDANGELVVDLSNLANLGFNFEAAGADMAKGVDAGIDQIAQTEISMLDSMIQLMETIVAMELLGDIDVEGNGIDFSDLFEFNADTGERDFEKFSKGYEQYRDYVLQRIDKENYPKLFNEDLANGINKTKIQTGGVTVDFGLLLKMEPSELKKYAEGDLGEAYAAILQAYKLASLSGDYSEDSIFESIKSIIAGTGFEGEIDLGDLHLTVTQGVTLTRDPDGNYNVDGYKTKDKDAALRAMKTSNLTALQSSATKITHDLLTGNTIYTNDLITVTTNYDIATEQYTATFSDGGQVSASSQEALNTAIKVYLKARNIDIGSTQDTSDATTETLAETFSVTIPGQATVNYDITQVDGKTKITDKTTGPVLNEEAGRNRTTLNAATQEVQLEINNTKNETKDALDANQEQAKDGVTQDIKNNKNETGDALNENITTAKAGVILNITDGINAVLATLNANIRYAKEHPVVQSIQTTSSVTGADTGTLSGTIAATGNVGLANAKGTLMGELGPELVVSNGRYFVAGQNGPEMVDLADDAIVFNHLQTKSLLEKGTSFGRGKAVTNERNAVAFATGNINGGPAMASASAALAALKQLRSMWQSLLGSSVKDLAGAGGGGGGGGGGNDAAKDPAFVKDLEKWYNWLQRIAVLEEKINYEEAKRNKIASDMIAHGQDYAKSLLESFNYLKEQTAVHQSLVDSQLVYFNLRREQMNSASNPFSALYTFDEYGQLKYKNGALAQLSEIISRDLLTGKGTYTASEQYAILKNNGFERYMQYDSSGNEIDRSQEGWETNAILAFWDKIDADKEEMQSLHDSIEEHKKAVLEDQEKANEILKEIEDNLISVEDRVLKAIEDTRQREIDELLKQRDAIEESANNLINGLSELLNREKDMYSQLASLDELTRLLRQLGILLNSGGSASQIASLLKEIGLKQLDAYFEAQLRQIDTLLLASLNELERLDRLIDLMTESLEYEKENGLLWGAVYEVMAGTPEQITSFITEHDSQYWGVSPTLLTLDTREILFEAQLFVTYRLEMKDGITGMIDAFNSYKVETEKQLEDTRKLAMDASGANSGSAKKDTGGGSGGSPGGASKPAGNSKSDEKNQNKNSTKHGYTVRITLLGSDKKSYVGTASHENMSTAVDWAKRNAADRIPPGVTYKQSSMSYDRYLKGGLIDYTGPAWVDGSKSHPESVLTAEQTAILRNDILSNKPTSLLNLLTDFRDAYGSIAGANSYGTINNNAGVTIEQATVEMHVAQIANDYDASRAGEQALEKIMAIARKSLGSTRIGR